MWRRAAVFTLGVTCLLATTLSARPDERSCTYLEGQVGRIYYEVFIVFFDYDGAAIRPEASRTLENVAEAYRPLSHCRLLVAAHTDRVGSDAYNLTLSRRRAEAVVAFLRERGVRAAPQIESFGEMRPLVETEDGVAEPQNRRAEIIIAPRDRE